MITVVIFFAIRPSRVRCACTKAHVMANAESSGVYFPTRLHSGKCFTELMLVEICTDNYNLSCIFR